MYYKIAGITTALAMVILSWYLYSLYPYTLNLVFAIGMMVAAFATVIFYYLSKNQNETVEKGVDRLRIILTAIAFLTFLIFVGLNFKLGGSAEDDYYASIIYENYEAGQYYLSSHGNFTVVTYSTWIRMKILEQIVIPLFLIAFIWNFLHVAKTKGMKYLLTGKQKDAREYNGFESKTSKIQFIILAVILVFFAVMVLISIF